MHHVMPPKFAELESAQYRQQADVAEFVASYHEYMKEGIPVKMRIS